MRNSTLVQVKLNGSEYFRKPISATGQLEAQVLYLGGPPLIPVSRVVRQVDFNVPTASNILLGIPRIDPVTATIATTSMYVQPQPLPTTHPEDHFKGIIQDVQISNGSRTMIVEFFPLQVSDLAMPQSFGTVSFDNSTILEGVVSDNTCLSNPCKHNGTCKVTWNDFR